MIGFSDSIVMLINDCHTVSTDVIYFDFSKAFDSVNHDIILHKLKHIFKIDGRLLKFLKNYLCDREQCVVIDGIKSSFTIWCSSGFNYRSYSFRPFYQWFTIKCDSDNLQLQKDIQYLSEWSVNNKISFNLQKCKVVSIKNRPSPIGNATFCGISLLPCRESTWICR